MNNVSNTEVCNQEIYQNGKVESLTHDEIAGIGAT